MFFYAALIFGIFIFQTGGISALFRGSMYDLFLPLVFHMGMVLPFKKALVLTVAAGFLADSLSFAPFGIYLSSHIWYLAVLKWGHGFLHIRNPFFLPPVLCLGVVMQEMLFAGAHLVCGTLFFSAEIWKEAAAHVLWAGLTAPFFVTGISVLRKQWQERVKKIFPAGKNRKAVTDFL